MNISRTQKGFTLIELITVIAIILILMGLLFPALNSVKESAKKAQAKNDEAGIVTAVKAFYTEYGKYPMPNASYAAGTDTIFGDSNNAGTNKSYQLFNVLRNVTTLGSTPVPNAADVALQNPRGIVFMEGNTAKNSKAGFDSSGNFFDPWGRTYAVAVDLSYDNVTQTFTPQYTDITSSYSTEPPPSSQVGVPGGVVVISFGRDGKQGTNGDMKYQGSDDIISWQ